MQMRDVAEFVIAGKNALDLLKAIRKDLPKGPRAEELLAKIDQAEKALSTSEAAAARALGYRLCQCTFPPQTMLWKEDQREYACPNAACGRKEPWPKMLTRSGLGGRANSWTAAPAEGRSARVELPVSARGGVARD
jgi:hypothetical protein